MRFDGLTRTGGVAGFVFLTFAWLTTQIGSLRAAMPFTEDPFDAVTSFAVIAIGVVGGATVIRWLAHVRRAPDAAVERRIALGAALVTGTAAMAIASDLVALAVVGVPAPDVAVVVGLALLAVTFGAVLLALADVWRARASLFARTPEVTDEPDLIDDIGAIAGSVGARALATRVSRWLETSRFSPRRHRLLVGVLGAGVAGLGAIVWHAVLEGAWASPVAAMVFGGLIALGVIGAYLVGLEPLRLIRPPGLSSRTS